MLVILPEAERPDVVKRILVLSAFANASVKVGKQLKNFIRQKQKMLTPYAEGIISTPTHNMAVGENG